MSTNHARLGVFWSTVLVGAIAMTIGSGQTAPSQIDGSSNVFLERVASYAQLRQRVIADLLDSGFDPDAGGGLEFRRALGTALRDARRYSQPGDIFCPEVAGRMRMMVWNAVSNRPLRDQQEILSEVPEVPRVRINDFYPEGEPLATVPPVLLQQFDQLPPELQYRFLADSLILLDIDTALIVDFIPNALARSS